MFTEIPRKRNSPPRIVLTSVKPDLDTTIGPLCKREFSFSVEDPDVGDPIRHRWFVYKPFEQPFLIGGAGFLPGGSSIVRPNKIVAPPSLFNSASELMQNGEHRLEVVIADGELGDVDQPLERDPTPLPDGGTVVDKTYIDSYVWIVKTSDTTPACE